MHLLYILEGIYKYLVLQFQTAGIEKVENVNFGHGGIGLKH